MYKYVYKCMYKYVSLSLYIYIYVCVCVCVREIIFEKKIFVDFMQGTAYLRSGSSKEIIVI